MSPSDPVVQRRLGELGRRVRQARMDAGFSQEELAERAGLHRTYVGSVERGERNISIKNLWALTDALGVQLASIVDPRSDGGTG